MNDKLKHKIIQYLNSEFGDLEQFEVEEHPDYVFFIKDGETIFDYDLKNGYACVSYDKIWSFLESFFGLKYEEIRDLTKEWVGEYHKLRVRTTRHLEKPKRHHVEEHYKLRVTSTTAFQTNSRSEVERHYKFR